MPASPARTGTAVLRPAAASTAITTASGRRHAPVRLALHEQIEKGIPYLRSRYGAEKFIVYFQPFTNTYASVDILERLYREALAHPGVVGLAIGTRPDCVDEEKIALLEALARDHFVLVEYGLQSIYDHTLSFINRGHDYACFRKGRIDDRGQRDPGSARI